MKHTPELNEPNLSHLKLVNGVAAEEMASLIWEGLGQMEVSQRAQYVRDVTVQLLERLAYDTAYHASSHAATSIFLASYSVSSAIEKQVPSENK